MYNYLKDDDFIKEFKYWYPEGLDADAVTDNYIHVTTKFEQETITMALNVFNAAVVSDYSYSELMKTAVRHLSFLFKDDAEALIRVILLQHLLVTGKLNAILNKKRDFIAEVIAESEGIRIEDVTEDIAADFLKRKDAVYSIEDKPIEGWDQYFFNICRQVARHSKCLSRRIGAVLVKDKSIISTGYNGPPRGVPRCDERWVLDDKFIKVYGPQIKETVEVKGKCPRYPLGAKSGQMLNICTAAHAEENSIIDAARRGVKVKGATMYMTCGIPCTQCLIKIINAGIKEIVVTGVTFYDENAEWLLNNSDVKVRLYNF